MPKESREPLDADRLRAAVGDGWSVRVADVVGSTNAELLADPATPDHTVLAAEEQNIGRGRLERAWVSPPRAGLLFSVLLRPTVRMERWGWLPLLAGVALHRAVADETGLAVQLKWPNDLLDAADGKLAGVLVQTRGSATVVGVGMNVSTRPDELPGPTATSLELSGAAAVDRTALLAAVLRRLDEWLERWEAADGDAERSGVAAAYRAACGTLGREVSVSTLAGEEIRGRAVDIDPGARLVVASGGTRQAVGAGDVRHLRPAG